MLSAPSLAAWMMPDWQAAEQHQLMLCAKMTTCDSISQEEVPRCSIYQAASQPHYAAAALTFSLMRLFWHQLVIYTLV